MRLTFFSDPDGDFLVWKRIETRSIISVESVPQINTVTIGTDTFKVFSGFMLNPIFQPAIPTQQIVSSYEDLHGDDVYSFVTKYGAGGGLRFQVNAFHNHYPSPANRVGLKSFTWNGQTLLNAQIVQTSDSDLEINTYDLIYSGEEFIVFSLKIDTGVYNVMGITKNAFQGSATPRFVPPTTPDTEGGYGTGSTPSGNQDGSVINVDVGGDTVNVAPPNVAVDVQVNMPELDQPQVNHPSGINIALASNNAIDALNNALWGRSADGFNNLWIQFQNYNYNPMKAIISCIKLPRWVTTALNATAAAEQDIAVAGTTLLNFVGKPIARGATVRKSFVTASLSQFNTFQDFVGVTIRAYAPFVGWFELDPSLCCGISTITGNCVIEFEYTVDATNGNVGVIIWAYTTGKSDTQAHRTPIASGSGNCAYPVLLSANDRGISDVVGGFTQIIGGLATMTGGAVTGNAPLAIGGGVSMFSGAMQATLAQQHTTTVGGVSGSVGYLNYLIPFVMVIKPRYIEPENYTPVYGRPSYAKSLVSDFEGHWAQLDVHCENFGFANEREQKLIIDALAKGVYV